MPLKQRVQHRRADVWRVTSSRSLLAATACSCFSLAALWSASMSIDEGILSLVELSEEILGVEGVGLGPIGVGLESKP